MSECPKCGMRDDDWFLCQETKALCPVRHVDDDRGVLLNALTIARKHLVNITGGDTSLVPQEDQDLIDRALGLKMVTVDGKMGSKVKVLK